MELQEYANASETCIFETKTPAYSSARPTLLFPWETRCFARSRNRTEPKLDFF